MVSLAWFCEQWRWLAYVIFAAGTAPFLVTLLCRRTLLRRFDEEARAKGFFHDAAEETLGNYWYSFRRAYLYVLAVGARWAAHRRFPGMDFRAGLTTPVVVLGTIALYALALFVALLLPGSFLMHACGTSGRYFSLLGCR